MLLSIDGGSYATAATAFADANQVAALLHDSLTGKLGACAAMAGDDSTAADFATAYDTAAIEGVRALGDLVDAFATLGRLTEQSLANHRHANAASVLSDTLVPGATVYEGTTLPETGYVTVLPATPPSSLGGDPPGLSFEENWILDRVEGFVWPNADTARLRDAAHLWRTTAEGLDQLAAYCDTAARGFGSQRSPEIPVALEATTALRATIDDLATQYAALATSCESYAAEVDTAHERTRALLREVLTMVVEGILVSVAIGLISAGAGAVIGAGSVVARVAAQSPRFVAILTTLRAAAATSAHSIHATRTNLHAIRARLDRYLGLPARNEAGHLRFLPDRWGPGFLTRHQRGGGHPISTHVAQSRRDLALRFGDPRPPPFASTFPDQATAESAILAVLRRHSERIDSWLVSTQDRLILEGSGTKTIGSVMDPAGNVAEVTGVRIVLDRAPTLPDGLLIKTAYPIR